MLDDIKLQFKNGGYLTRLLYINCGIFLALKLAVVICMLFELPDTWVEYLEMPSSLVLLAHRPWTVITYMFTHLDFLHVIFNLLALFWFGQIFLTFLNQKQLVGVYFLGGLAGAAVYLLSMHTIPYFSSVADSGLLLGASASVMAVIFAVASCYPNNYIRLALIGNVRLKYLGLALFVLDILGITASNPGGAMAHLGGALFGMLYGTLLRTKHVDLSRPVTAVMDFFANLGSGRSKRAYKPKMKIKFTKKKDKAQSSKTESSQNGQTYRRRSDSKNARIDEILDKIKKYGYAGLTEEEKKELFDISHNKNR